MVGIHQGEGRGAVLDRSTFGWMLASAMEVAKLSNTCTYLYVCGFHLPIFIHWS